MSNIGIVISRKNSLIITVPLSMATITKPSYTKREPIIIMMSQQLNFVFNSLRSNFDSLATLRTLFTNGNKTISNTTLDFLMGIENDLFLQHAKMLTQTHMI